MVMRGRNEEGKERNIDGKCNKKNHSDDDDDDDDNGESRILLEPRST